MSKSLGILAGMLLLPAISLTPIAPAGAQSSTAVSPWSSRESNAERLLSDIAFVNDSQGWACGLNVITRTLDGGSTWQKQWTGKDAFWLNSIAALSPEVAIAAGTAYGREGGGILLVTRDGGTTWNPVPCGDLNGKLHSVRFRSDGKTGYVISSAGTVLKSVDAGATWNPVQLPGSTYRFFIAGKGALSLPDSKTVVVGGDGAIFISTDDGATWQNHPIPDWALGPHKLLSWVTFSTAKDGWFQTLGGDIAETHDGGATWSKSTVPGQVFAQSPTQLWAANDMKVWLSADGGKTWPETADISSLVLQNANLTRLAFTGRHAWVAGGNEGAGFGFLAARLLPGIKASASAAPLHAPIPIRIKLDKPSIVTLVIDDAKGKRVRNLISETPLPAGDNTLWWDGLDESGRKNETINGIYEVQGKLVSPGTYRIRGLIRDNLNLRYLTTIYNPGNPPWETSSKDSGWLTNHTPPAAVLYLPPGKAPDRDGKKTSNGQLLVGSKIAEGGAGLAWLDATDGKKLWGQMWVGGVWTGAAQLARDAGNQAVEGVYAYTASGWPGDGYNGKKPELRLHELLRPEFKRDRPGAWENGVWNPNATAGPNDGRMGSGEDRPLLAENYPLPHLKEDAEGVRGLAVYNGTVVASLPSENCLLLIDAKARKVIRTIPLEDPRGLAIESNGSLLALSGSHLLRFTNFLSPSTASAQVVGGLDQPENIALDSAGNIYLSLRGKSHCVKVFTAAGKPLRTIGKPGVPAAGPYDEQRMQSPAGLTIANTPEGERLWITEEDFQPKRLSVWKLDGTFVRGYYGPTIYGGGGSFDPADKTRFFHDGIEFKVDWTTGRNWPAAIYHRPAPGELDVPAPMFGKRPESALRINTAGATGKLYLTNAYTGHPTNGTEVTGLWVVRNGVARLVAAAGLTSAWPPLMKALSNEVILKAGLLAGADIKAGAGDPNAVTFVWTDTNDDGKFQPSELQYAKGYTWGGVTVGTDGAFTLPSSARVEPLSFSATGIPQYDLKLAKARFGWQVVHPTSGGGQILDFAGGVNRYSVAVAGPLQGFRNGQLTWTYPNQWPGLHASHLARVPEKPGEVIGATRLLSQPLTLQGSTGNSFQIFGLNTNMGNLDLLTDDGLYVGTLFRDHRLAKAWPDKAVTGTLFNETSAGGESFFNTISQVGNEVFAQNTNQIFKVEGLNTLQRLPESTIQVTPELLKGAQDYFVAADAARQASKGPASLTVPVGAAPTFDGNVDEWSNWVDLDVKTKAAARIADNTLYVAFKTGYQNLLKNKAESLPLLFKTGGALDIMIAANPIADPKRTAPVAGDQRLLITRVSDGGTEKLVAVRYRAVVTTGDKKPVPFASPTRTVTFDRVDDIGASIKLAQGKAQIEEFHAGNVFGNRTDKYTGDSYEVAIPLLELGIKVKPDLALRGDLGILLGNGFQTVQRIYWSNKSTGLVSDIPGEAMLTPQLWGRWELKPTP